MITGGGSGHEPAFIGYVGRNMLDAVAVGEIFSSPTAKSFYDAMKIADGGRGVVCLYGNYAGDNMNVKMAVKLAAKDGLEVLTVVANDDVCSAPPDQREKRRGVAGEILMWKCGAAKAALGGTAREVQAVAQKAIDNCRSIGVGLGPCTLPAVGHPNFSIEAGKMEVGIGHHGEPGMRVEPLKTAAEVGRDMAKAVLDDHGLAAGTEVAVLISGLGATPTNELYILNDAIEDEVRGRGLKIARTYVGNLLHLAGDGRRDADDHGARRGAQGTCSPSTWRAPRRCEERPMQAFSNAGSPSGDIVLAIAQRIVENRGYLSDIDGLIGDGDHGVNMAKGFSLAAERLRGEPQSLAASLATLGDVLMTEIGGSMGPLYGMMFSGFAEALDGVEEIDAAAFERMLRHGLEEVQSIGDAKVGDKTLIDAFAPALQAFSATAAKRDDFAAALDALIVAAEKGRDSTVDLVAKIGRASRLGERSRGVLDPGATSCAIILRSLAEGAKAKLDASNPGKSREAQP